MRAKLLIAGLASALAFGVAGPGAAQTVAPAATSADAPAPSADYRRDIIFTYSKLRAVDRGVLTAPAFHGRPGSPLIQMPFIRFRSADGGGAPVFLLSGGPGGTYLDNLTDADMEPWFDKVLERSDLIILEQRGSETSFDSLACQVRADLDPSVPLTSERHAGIVADAMQACRDRYAAKGVPVAAYNVVDMARDVHLLADELGYERFSLFGGKFGSQLALTIMREDPSRVYRAVLHNIEGPDHSMKSSELFDGHMDRVSAAVNGNWQIRLLTGDFRRYLEKTVDRLAKKPIVGEVKAEDGETIKVAVGDFDFKQYLYSFRGLRGYRRGMARVARDVALLRLGRDDFALGAKQRLVAQLKKGQFRRLMAYLVRCASSPREQWVEPGDVNADWIFGPEIMDVELRAVCRALDMEPLPPSAMAPVRVDNEVVLINGGLDGLTPPEYSREVAANLPNAHLIEVPLGDNNGFAPLCLNMDGCSGMTPRGDYENAWAAREADSPLMNLSLEFLAGDASIDAFPDTIDRGPLVIRLAPNWTIAAGLGLVLLLALLVALAGLRLRAGK